MSRKDGWYWVNDGTDWVLREYSTGGWDVEDEDVCFLYARKDVGDDYWEGIDERCVNRLPNVDELAQIIREIDGQHTMGAGVLAEKILERL